MHASVLKCIQFSYSSNFINNTAGIGGGIADVAHSPLQMNGYNRFLGNTGPALRVSVNLKFDLYN